MNSDRAYILNALRRTARPSKSRVEYPIEESPGRSRIPAKDLEQGLSSAIEMLGGHFHRARSEDEVTRILCRLIQAANVRKVAALLDDDLGKIPFEQAVQHTDARLASYSEAEIGDSLENVIAGLKDVEMGVFRVFRALAQSGTMVLKGNAGLSRAISLIPPIIVGILDKECIVADLGDVFSELIDKDELPSQPGDWMVCISGPSRTADIEATLTTGIHGPGETHLIVRV